MVAHRNRSELQPQGMSLWDVVVAARVLRIKNKGHECFDQLFVLVRLVALEMDTSRFRKRIYFMKLSALRSYSHLISNILQKNFQDRQFNSPSCPSHPYRCLFAF